jgi:hypothetical protein
MDGFTFSFYIFSSVLGYKLGIKIILFDSLYAQETSLPQSFQRGTELTFSDTGGDFSGVQRPWRTDTQTLLSLPRLRMCLATLSHSYCLYGTHSSNTTVMYLLYLQVVGEISIMLL